MNYQDLIVTPVFLILIYALAFPARRVFADKNTSVYFIPGLTLKIIGAISLGLVYQYYYQGGDTFNYFDHGSRYIWEALLESPMKGLKLILANGEYSPDTYQYASNIIYYTDLPSYFVVRMAGIFDVITYHTYSSTAILFAIFSFSGIWAMYLAFYRLFPRLHLQFAIALFFIPSVFFWGSGILKDSITLGALGWATYAFIQIFIFGKRLFSSSVILVISFFMIYQIKIYILLSFIPALLIWFYIKNIKKIRNLVLRAMILPFSFIILLAGGYYSVKTIGEENRRYNLERLSYTAESTARWLSYVSDREQGSGYTLGDFDYSIPGIIRKSPAAVWVTLFRPYPWEARNLAMFLSAIESFSLLVFVAVVLIRIIIRQKINIIFSDPVVIFCFTFSLIFAFAIGISTYNFGSLVRYKIPLLPFFMVGLFILWSYSKRLRKFVLFASDE